jgi:hypothetical protein
MRILFILLLLVSIVRETHANPPYLSVSEIRQARFQKGELLTSEELFEEVYNYKIRFPLILKSARALVEDEATALLCAYLPYASLKREIKKAVFYYRLMLSHILLREDFIVLEVYVEFFVVLKRVYDSFDEIYDCVPCLGGGCMYRYSQYGL